ncbi:MAG: PEGA domain-containing protein [Myxococcales bacterium]
MSLHRAGAFWLSACIAWAAGGGAVAQRAVLLPARGDEALAAQRRIAGGSLRELLEAEGLQVLDHDAVQGVACESVECATDLLDGADAEIAVAPGVWAGTPPARVGAVFVTLIDRAGKRFPGRARARNDDVAEAVREALLDARALQLLGPGPWLRVRGTPPGAEVWLDGTLVGALPHRGPVEAGRHSLEVRHEGYRPLVRSADVPDDASRQVDVEVALRPREAAAAADPLAGPDEAPPAGRPVVGPLVLGLAGVGLLTADVVLVLSAGCERRDAGGRCAEEDQVAPLPAIALAVGGAGAITAALLWHLLGGDDPPPVALSATRDRATVRVNGRF